MNSDDERVWYLAGETVESLSDAERAQLDEFRLELSDPVAWIEPSPDLEQRVVDAVATVAFPARRARPSRAPARRWFQSHARAAVLACVIAVAAAAGVIVVATRDVRRLPEQFAMAISGTSLAPGAHGSATLTKTASGRRVQLAAVGLPHLDGHRFYYEAWLKNAAGVLVPIGTFNDARSVTLWSGVPVTVFRGLTATIQRLGAGPASSGRKVLIGRIRPN
jgi:anti-sigma-K factor RskA